MTEPLTADELRALRTFSVGNDDARLADLCARAAAELELYRAGAVRRHARGGDVLHVHPSAVLANFDRATILVEFLAEDSAKRGDVAGSDAYRVALDAMHHAFRVFGVARSQQTHGAKLAQEVLPL